MKIAKLLTTEHDIEAGAKMKGLIYNIHAEIGMFIAVEGKYQGLIPIKEVTKRYHVGSEIEFKVSRVRDDGRLDLTLHEGGFTQMEQDEETLFNALTENGGFLPINDRTDKEKINKELDMSKRAFKRALGRLMKSGKCIINYLSRFNEVNR
jgi:predicted RNA-binding protein (virulence factor B family)